MLIMMIIIISSILIMILVFVHHIMFVMLSLSVMVYLLTYHHDVIIVYVALSRRTASRVKSLTNLIVIMFHIQQSLLVPELLLLTGMGHVAEHSCTDNYSGLRD